MTLLLDNTWKHIYQNTNHIFATEISIYMDINTYLRAVNITKQFIFLITK